MCEFCVKHGEGKKWYLVMRNYSEVLRNEKHRDKFINYYWARFEDYYRGIAKVDKVKNVPIVGRIAGHFAERQMKTEEWGQVVPIEDVEQILDMQDSIVRLPCVCRKMSTGLHTRYCIGVGVDDSGILGKYPDLSYGLELLEKEEAKELLRSFDEKGLVHKVYTFITPYIGTICNCDQDCLSYRAQEKVRLVRTTFRAEYVALVDWDLCNGCRNCLSRCQYGAIHFSNTLERPTIEMSQCHGCGVCRVVCEQKAISLKPRSNYANLPW
jgi:Pyruvate/2-oxoacid:ferredoxin oxidoreductase delta subunit